jgi:hypothetical protein
MFDTYTYGVCLVDHEQRRYTRTFMHGVITLKIREHEFPVHRDLLAPHYSFFKNMPDDFESMTLDPAIVTPDALDYVLSFHYPNAPAFDQPSLALCSEVVVAWDFFGGGLEARDSTSDFLVVGGPSDDTLAWVVARKMLKLLDEPWIARRIEESVSTQLPRDTIVDAMKRHPDIFGTVVDRYEKLTDASPEKQRMLIKRIELKQKYAQVPLNTLSKTDLCREFGKKYNGKKEDLVHLLAEQRAQKAFALLMETCDVAESARRALFQDMVHAASYTSELYTHYMLPSGQILKTKVGRSSFTVKDPVIDGPCDVTQYFFHDCGAFPDTVALPCPAYGPEGSQMHDIQCVQGAVDTLCVLRDRLVDMYAL